MSGGESTCRHVRLQIGAEPQALPPDVAAHLETCAACRQFHDETLRLDGRLRAALELPLHEFRTAPAQPTRRYAIAASVMIGLLVAGGAWLFRPAPALAGEVVEHVKDEMGSWDKTAPASPDDVARVLGLAGVHFDAKLPIVYAMPCKFKGRRIAHFVVQTANGPMTVMLLPHEQIAAKRRFSEDGMSGVLLPAGEGGIAILSRGGNVPDSIADEVVSDVRW
jgi:hypothetical protein